MACLPLNVFKNNHNRVGNSFHWKIFQYYDQIYRENRYENKPKPVIEGDIVNWLGDFTIHTRMIQVCRRDIVIQNVKQHKCYLIEMIILSKKRI